MLGEQRDVVAPLAQRQRLDREHAEPVVEVLAEPAALHLLLEVAVGGGDHAHVDGAGALLADALELALLQHAQQLGLQLERDLADLVEEQRAAVGELEAADAVAQRAGERALLVAEELALEQLARDRRAVDADQRPVAALGCASWMARAISSLPVPVSPVISTVASVGATSLHLAQHLPDRRALADDAARIVLDTDFFLKVGVLELEPLAQLIDLREGCAQLFLRFAALADVTEHDHRADDEAAVSDGGRRIFDPDRLASLRQNTSLSTLCTAPSRNAP